jgi:hypothetical protein
MVAAVAAMAVQAALLLLLLHQLMQLVHLLARLLTAATAEETNSSIHRALPGSRMKLQQHQVSLLLLLLLPQVAVSIAQTHLGSGS